MKFKKKVGLVSYGVSLPNLAISYGEIAQAHGVSNNVISCPSGIKQKTVPDLDEDSTTLAVAAGLEVMDRWQGDTSKIGGLFVGSESHPYVVKPTGTVVKTALGLSNPMALADLEFACKAGTQGLQIGVNYVVSGMTDVVLAIGADTAQAEPGDALEYAAGAGAAAMLVGKNDLLVEILASTSYATDTPDFWRRPTQQWPQHAGRFTGDPAYFHHVITATKQLLSEVNLIPEEIDYCVFHTPNAKFPIRVAKKLGFSYQQLEPSLAVTQIGNAYSAASLIALSSVLDQAKANKTILLTSYGSGAGADSFLFKTTPLLVKKRKYWQSFLKDKINQLQSISYSSYLKHTNAH